MQAPEQRVDPEIKADVEKALKWDAYVDHEMIVVKVDDGIVNLWGTVGSAAEKRLARIDAYVFGVKAVNDTDLKVARWMRDDDLRKKKYADKSEEEIRKAVEDALLYDPRVSSFKITTEVSGNTVTLRGTVDNLKAKRAAARDARNTVGVRGVDNHIKVRPRAEQSAASIRAKVEKALVRDPYVSGRQIEVDMYGGVATLSGTVDSWSEYHSAEENAYDGGAVYVDNDLMVKSK